MRYAVDLKALGEFTIVIDCDVIQADGGTRTAAITGGCVALYDAIEHLMKHKLITAQPFQQFVAAVSVGVSHNVPVIDLDYAEDSSAETDMNVGETYFVIKTISIGRKERCDTFLNISVIKEIWRRIILLHQ